MQFDSFTFLVFFGVALIVYNALADWRARKWFLLAASYLFYAAWNPYFLVLLVGSTTLDWWIAQRIDAADQPRDRKVWVSITLIVNLGVLALFKYNRFMLDNLAALLALVGVHYVPARFDIVLPIGISFYTFHSLSYCIDIYRRKFAPTRNWRDYALVRRVFPATRRGPDHAFSADAAADRKSAPDVGQRSRTRLLAARYSACSKKMFWPIRSSRPLPIRSSTPSRRAAAPRHGAACWRSAGKFFATSPATPHAQSAPRSRFGFQLPINFRFPYAAVGFSDFWRRWHISLSTWLRDYLYISLGGNRRGEVRTYVNLMLTMLIGGLWHGAAWTFVIWGGLHGVYLAVERAIRERVVNRSPSPPLKFLYGLITLFFVVVAWVWFRSPDIATASGVFATMFSATGVGHLAGFGAAEKLAIAAFVLVVAVHWLMRERDLIADTQRLPRPLLGVLLGILLALIVLSPGDNHAFIYFQF